MNEKSNQLKGMNAKNYLGEDDENKKAIRSQQQNHAGKKMHKIIRESV